MSIKETINSLHFGVVGLNKIIKSADKNTRMSPARLSILTLLKNEGAMSLSELCAFEQVRAPTMTNIIKGLKEEKMVRDSKNNEDKRKTKISISFKGKKALEKALQTRLDHLESAVDNFSKEDMATILKFSKILKNIS